jgi:putative hemolysin
MTAPHDLVPAVAAVPGAPAVPAPTRPAAATRPAVPTLPTAAPGTPPPRYSVRLAADQADVRAAQRLRHQVFAGEMGAVLNSPLPGLDVDPFDDHCDHLLVSEERTGAVVGTYRLLSPAAAARAGRTYSDSEFDLGALDGLRSDIVEVGRSCIHPDHRDGAVIGMMWGGILRYLLDNGHTRVAGCCSVPLADGGSLAAGVWDRISAKHLSPPELRVRPHRPWDPAGVQRPARTTLPPLLRGYLRLGAWVCGEPAHDPDFGVADLYVLLSLDRTDPRYLRHFMSMGPTGPA